MITYLSKKLSHHLLRAEQRRVERILSQSSDLCELERRLRALEHAGSAATPGVPSSWRRL